MDKRGHRKLHGKQGYVNLPSLNQISRRGGIHLSLIGGSSTIYVCQNILLRSFQHQVYPRIEAHI